jgi:hypothetical protein
MDLKNWKVVREESNKIKVNRPEAGSEDVYSASTLGES